MKACGVSMLSAAALLALVADAAVASDRWEQAAAGGAAAILPKPARADGIVGGSLACAEQAWSFRLRTDGTFQLPSGGVSIVVDGETFAGEATMTSRVIAVPVDYEILDPLKAGATATFAFGSAKPAPRAVFSLRGSGKVLEAIAPRCSQIDMSAYVRVALSETDPAVDVARPLLADEAALFREATGTNPALAAASLSLPEGRGMLFATLCGSTRYYGRSGCTLSGFVRETPWGKWRFVYNSEGVALYTDPNAGNGGWPNLVTLPIVNGVERSHFVFTGQAYELRDHIVAEEDQFVEGQGDIAQ